MKWWLSRKPRISRRDLLNKKNYCAKVIFDGNIGAFDRFVSKNTNSKLILLIDGRSEGKPKLKQKFIEKLRLLNLLEEIRLVVCDKNISAFPEGVGGNQRFSNALSSFIPHEGTDIRGDQPNCETIWSRRML